MRRALVALVLGGCGPQDLFFDTDVPVDTGQLDSTSDSGDTDPTLETGDTPVPLQLTLDSAHAEFLGGASYGLGGSVTGGRDFDGDGTADVVALASASIVQEQGVYLFPGPITAGDHPVQRADATVLGVHPGQEGLLQLATLALAGDNDGDGTSDLLVGAWPMAAADPEEWPFRAYLVHGPVPAGESALGSVGWVISSPPGEEYGVGGTQHGLACAGDVDGDGLDDMVLGLAALNHGEGGAAVITGPVEDHLDVFEAGTLLHLDSYGANAGDAVAGVGDVDGDGLDDVAIGAQGYFNRTGLIAVVLSPQPASLELSEADHVWTGEEPGNRVGFLVRGGGDMDGDGYAEVVVGAPWSGEDYTKETLYVLSGPLDQVGSLADAEGRLEGVSGIDARVGSAFSAGEDVDGDGLDDLAVGVLEGRGTTRLYWGPVRGRRTIDDANVILKGEHPWGAAGRSELVPDMSGDGLADLVIGGTGTPYVDPDDGSESNGGSVWVVYADAAWW